MCKTGTMDPDAVAIDLLLEEIRCRYGFDFSGYARASLRRRVLKVVGDEKLQTISELQETIAHDPAKMERILLTLSINVSSFFRDTNFFLAFRAKVVPLLRSYPFVRIWHAGCATGEEVYSMAILLHEAGLHDKCIIYATDMNEAVLEKAKAGIFPLSSMKEYTSNYIRSGGEAPFSEYYSAQYNSAAFRSFLKDRVVFARHNLVTDESFNEFNVILCRNVMIYFGRALQNRVHELLYRSLGTFGVLGLGDKESITFSPHAPCYQELAPDSRLYRKVR